MRSGPGAELAAPLTLAVCIIAWWNTHTPKERYDSEALRTDCNARALDKGVDLRATVDIASKLPDRTGR